MISQDIIQLINEININISADPKERMQQKQLLDRELMSPVQSQRLINQQTIAAQLQSKNNQFKKAQGFEAKREGYNSKLKNLQRLTGLSNRVV